MQLQRPFYMHSHTNSHTHTHHSVPTPLNEVIMVWFNPVELWFFSFLVMVC